MTQKRQICNFALRFIIYHQIDYPIKLTTICKKLGYKIVFYTSDDSTCKLSDDGFTLLNEGTFIIYINQDQPKNRQRFTLAHEMAHIILNHLDDDSTTSERDANLFAGVLLAPSNVILKLMKKGKNEKEISHTLKISSEALKYRLKNLKSEVSICREILHEYTV